MINKNHEVFRHKHIVIAGDHYNPLGIIRSLGEEGIKPIVLFYVPNIMMVDKSKYIGEKYYFNGIEDAYSFMLEKWGHEELKPFVYNGSDDSTLFLDDHYEELNDHFYFTNGQGGIARWMYKYDQTMLAEKCGIDIPHEEYLDRGVMPTTLNYPVMTKAANSATGGNWKKDTFICENEAELRAAYEQMSCEKILVQEFIKKKNELCIDGISINGGEEIYMPYACNYHRFTDKSFGLYMRYFPFEDKELIEKIHAWVKECKFTGIFCIEFLVGPDGKYYFLENNLRNSAWSYAYTYGGYNLPLRWAISMLEGKLNKDDFELVPPFDAMDDIADLNETVFKLKKISLWQWLKEFHRCPCCYTYNANDKMPFVYGLLRKYIRVFKHRILRMK